MNHHYEPVPEHDAPVLLLIGAAHGGRGEQRRHHLLQRLGTSGEPRVLERAEGRIQSLLDMVYGDSFGWQLPIAGDI